MTAIQPTVGPLSRFWEWLGWRSRSISAVRTKARAVRSNAETRLVATTERVEKTDQMASWLGERNKQNHIAEALNAALSDPRTGEPR